MQMGQKEMTTSRTLAWHNYFWWSLTGATAHLLMHVNSTFTVKMLEVKRGVYKINVLSWEFSKNSKWQNKHAVACAFAISVAYLDWETVFYYFVTQFSNTSEASNIILASDLNFSVEMGTDGKIQVMDYSLMEQPRFGIHVCLPGTQGKFQCWL